MKTLAIDAGHGQSNRTSGVFDPGAVAGGKRESDLAWALLETLRYVASQEYAADVRIVLTRDTPTEAAPVGGRDNEATAEGADFFLSLHWNAADRVEATGTEVFYRGAEDLDWARRVLNASVNAFGLKCRGVKTESESQHSRLAVLDFNGPACLLEVGFITNPRDVERITSDDSRPRRVSWARAILDYVSEERG